MISSLTPGRVGVAFVEEVEVADLSWDSGRSTSPTTRTSKMTSAVSRWTMEASSRTACARRLL